VKLFDYKEIQTFCLKTLSRLFGFMVSILKLCPLIARLVLEFFFKNCSLIPSLVLKLCFIVFKKSFVL
jgi:hypothetical protein